MADEVLSGYTFFLNNVSHHHSLAPFCGDCPWSMRIEGKVWDGVRWRAVTHGAVPFTPA